MKTNNLITRKEYMANSKELHHAYYLQFATIQTKNYILSSLKIKDIKNALENGDIHLNKIKIPFNHMGKGGNWWWDYAPMKISFLKELGESNSYSTHTCVAKAMAKELTKTL